MIIVCCCYCNISERNEKNFVGFKTSADMFYYFNEILYISKERRTLFIDPFVQCKPIILSNEWHSPL